MPRKHDDDRRDRNERRDGGDRERSKPRPWNLWSVRLAILLTALGLGLWIYSAATASSRDESSSSSRSGLAAEMDSTDGEGGAVKTSDSRAIDDAAPATFRLGASFLGGFALAFLMKKFIKTTVIVLGLAAVAFFLLRRQGVVTLPWDQIEDSVSEGASWLRAQAGSIRDFLTGYLPSSAAAVFGGFVGFRKG
jgi:uncharacterized membrane protein (Fun14 family)